MIKLTPHFFAAIAASLLAACASPPPEVTASVPLLIEKATYDASYLSSNTANQLEMAAVGSVIVNGNEQISVIHQYVSALGMPCKKIIVSTPAYAPYKTAACKNDEGWFTTPSLMPIEAKKLN
ncbi:hypothetical protein K0504_06935 [Neiella marina]|uniref:Lipoprotein n=1 Tax=Neiella holothuriorum TaxID=2870530 RepID=A0ABS7EEJ8_9GAMM|nr:hypothetical protein [Neiella holothuriorum]MBW8190764.1 hypothetical protein [Neiella holothuriorum]